MLSCTVMRQNKCIPTKPHFRHRQLDTVFTNYKKLHWTLPKGWYSSFICSCIFHTNKKSHISKGINFKKMETLLATAISLWERAMLLEQKKPQKCFCLYAYWKTQSLMKSLISTTSNSVGVPKLTPLWFQLMSWPLCKVYIPITQGERAENVLNNEWILSIPFISVSLN